MNEYINAQMIIAGLVLSVIGILANTTRQNLSGGQFVAWAVVTVLVAFGMVVGAQQLLQ